jgi:hypothetical protein
MRSQKVRHLPPMKQPNTTELDLHSMTAHLLQALQALLILTICLALVFRRMDLQMPINISESTERPKTILRPL